MAIVRIPKEVRNPGEEHPHLPGGNRDHRTFCAAQERTAPPVTSWPKTELQLTWPCPSRSGSTGTRHRPGHTGVRPGAPGAAQPVRQCSSLSRYTSREGRRTFPGSTPPEGRANPMRSVDLFWALIQMQKDRETSENSRTVRRCCPFRCDDGITTVFSKDPLYVTC